jgi:iron complex outermembrane receptor protein
MRIKAILLASLALPFFPQAQAQAQEQAQEQAGLAGTDDVIIVTGTRRADRTVADSPVPIDVITGEQLRNSGFTETTRLLRDLVPSFNFPQPSLTDGTDTIRPASLRGLGPDQTLVLINGKRRHSSALVNINGSVGRGTQAVDINNIPTAAISRVEILRDGAAAQYGSDAIAGVINFQLNDARSGGRFAATYGGYRTRVSGVPEVTGLVLVNGQPTRAPDGTLAVTTGEDRRVNDGNQLTLSSNIGLPLGPEGFVNVTVEYRDRDRTNRTGADRREQYNVVGGVFDAREVNFDRITHLFGDPETEDWNAFVNMGVPLNEAIELYAIGSYANRKGNSAGFYRRAQDNRNVLAIYPDGFLPQIEPSSEDFALTGGLKGDLGEWRYDLSTQYGRNTVDYRIVNTLNASLGAASQTEFEAGRLRYSQWVNNLDMSRDFDVEGFSSVTLAFGFEYRQETYEIGAGELASYQAGPVRINQNNPLNTSTAPAAPGAQVFPGFQPVVGGVDITGANSRNNVSAYVELDVDVWQNWSVQMAGRFEDYSDFGSNFNGKLASRWAPFEWFAVRGAVSTGFRAPSVAQQFFGAAATNNVAGTLVDAVTLPVDNPVAVALGSTPLRPETSFSWSVGGVLNPVSGLDLTVDYYEVSITDRILLSENISATRAGQPGSTPTSAAVGAILDAAGFTNISAARFFINGIDTRTQGIDIIGTYRFSLGEAGRVALTAGYNWNRNRITGRRAVPGALGQVPGVELFGRQESLRIERGQPLEKLNLGLDYDWKWLGVTLRGNRFGEVLSPGGDAFTDLLITPAWVADAEVRVEPVQGIQIAIGANNVFDKYPETLATGRVIDPATGNLRNNSANNYYLPFSSFSPFGFNGRFVYGRVSYQF